MKLARWVCLLDSPSLVRANESNVQTRADWNTGASMWILMQSVGEVATLFPVHGGFVEVSLNIWLLLSTRHSNKCPCLQHCDRFVDPALSFAVSWLYYFMWSVFLASGKSEGTLFEIT